jgi:hypothetical protein
MDSAQFSPFVIELKETSLAILSPTIARGTNNHESLLPPVNSSIKIRELIRPMPTAIIMNNFEMGVTKTVIRKAHRQIISIMGTVLCK